MAYYIKGDKHTVWFLANVRTASTATAKAIMDNGGYQWGSHHEDLDFGHQGSHPPSHTGDLVVHTVRHHCDVILSYWYKKASGHTLEDFVELVLSGQHPLLSADGFYNNWLYHVNFPLKFENLDYEFSNLCLCAGLPDIKIPIGTNTKRPPNTKWEDVFPYELGQKVIKHFADELEECGYGRG